MANIFKPNKYQTFGLLKKHNIAKPDLPIINSVLKKFGLRLTEGYHQRWRDYKLPRDYRSFT